MEENVNPLNEKIAAFQQKILELQQEMAKVIVGQHKVIQLMITGLFSNGHILLEGVPGVAKTLLAKLLAKMVNIRFSRIQFTPDLMPGDVIGTSVFNPKEGNFYFKPGPIFSNVVLIDEINRAPAKTQSALFEVMEEKQVTIDGQTYFMEKPFLVLATQNPIEQEGTYRLPEAQLDRFLFKVEVGYPGINDEIAILTRQQGKTQEELLSKVSPVLNATDILTYRQMIEQVEVEPKLVEFMVKIIADTRNNPSLYLGASTRATLAILKAAKTTAALNGRHFVIPEDIVEVAPPVLRHRIMLTPEKEMEGLSPDELVDQIIKSLEIPR
ncbi:MAG TPA: MoxR family ATPase [Ferruginibacter sp.]|nr:MoxR family ATPase [Bacteroidota bacterium]MCC6692704.1 MoxR family ATPase [Chitinophagaceae bacterium]HMT96224.1 MoxR family ATPase [Ferruginibacter sp.]MBS1926639.1 MoxR family ATPase [Bacteroidota bacterium]HMU24449.1 MoxR family ATPase [Ferruginibacter sp.]